MEVKIALDAMGGDNAPAAEVIGAVEAFKKYGVKTLLVGQEEKLKTATCKIKSG